METTILTAMVQSLPACLMVGGLAWYIRDRFEKLHVRLAVLDAKFTAHLAACERHPR